MRVGSLFAGIGGFDLGLERAGMTIAWQSEIDEYASAVLRKHWPNVPNHGDIRNITAATVEPVDVLCGGFPCQDVSLVGKGAGLKGERSGLWREYARLIGELQPRYALVENVPGLLARGLGDVLGDLAALGYDAEWHCIPASYIGAPHRRDRVWIIAHARSERLEGQQQGGTKGRAARRVGREFADVDSVPMLRGIHVHNALAFPRARVRLPSTRRDGRDFWYGALFGSDAWPPFSGTIRVDARFPGRVDRIRCLGNSIVPQIAEAIGRAILNA